MICQIAPQFAGFQQHDSQEFLAFLLDGLHEDMNRASTKKKKKKSVNGGAGGSDKDPTSAEAWKQHLKRNESHVIDLFYGQFRSGITCMRCESTSTRFDPFMQISLPGNCTWEERERGGGCVAIVGEWYYISVSILVVVGVMAVAGGKEIFFVSAFAG